MSQTTTLRLPESLRERIADAATKRGTTAHAFMLEAIDAALVAAELQADMHQTADERMDRLLATGEGLLWDDVRPWLEARAAGQDAVAPRPRKWR